MEFVAFVLCTAVIVQTSAAPLESFPHDSNQFDLPVVARNGFEMTLETSIHNDFKKKLENQTSWIVIMETDDDEAKFCDTHIVEGMRICIVPKDDKPCDEAITTTFKLRVTAQVYNADDEQLLLQVYLNESHQIEKVTTFEQLKHVSMGGVIGDIKKLHFDFSKQAKS